MFIYDGVDIILKHDDTVDVNNLLLVPNPNHASADIASNDNINSNIINIINFVISNCFSCEEAYYVHSFIEITPIIYLLHAFTIRLPMDLGLGLQQTKDNMFILHTND
jgi:hypothetical protein